VPSSSKQRCLFCLLDFLQFTHQTYFYFFDRKLRAKRKLANMDIPDFENNPVISVDDILRDPLIPHIPQENLDLVERIGRGASGLVWRANWHWYVQKYHSQ
jgi:hypothetical protein